ncbi:MAG TPA: ABC transporter substrate-binding protein, partial [Candidatus Sulfotelmatobacter sp.]|nr:ABC transporter substrate-binding protein [Candidatus Sulfotelmatobacter sp.]
MRRSISRRAVLLSSGAALALGPGAALGQKKYDPGVTDSSIKLGSTAPYSGPASSFGAYGRAISGYFRMVNDRGGINGRKVDLISLDDAYSPPKTVEQTRKLVEEDGVFIIAGPLGTAPNAAIQKYLNAKHMPTVFLTSGGERFNNPKEYPYSIPLYPSYVTIGRVFAQFILSTKPDAKIAVIYMNDDLGKDHMAGFKQGLGAKAASMIVKEATYELSDAVVDSQVIAAEGSGADTLVEFTTPKFAAQIIRKVYDLNWKPLHIMAQIAASVGATLTPAGLDRSIGIVTAQWYKDPTDAAWAASPDMVDYVAFMKKYLPSDSLQDATPVPGYV